MWRAPQSPAWCDPGPGTAPEVLNLSERAAIAGAYSLGGAMTSATPTPVYLFGTLRDAALRRIVLGTDVATVPAGLPDTRVASVANGDWPVLEAATGVTAEGEVAPLSAEALMRADYFEGLFGYHRETKSAHVDGEARDVEVYVPDGPQPSTGADWSLAAWQTRHAPLARLVAADAMAMHGVQPPQITARRWPMMRARAQARLNAQSASPTTLRRRTEPGDVEIAAMRVPYAAFFSVEEYDLTHIRFDGTRSARMTRSAFVSADAVTVLPYDPARDHVLLIEQFRAGPLARGDSQCWSLEAIAGRIDPGETPEEAARREAREEARLDIGTLIPLASYYPTPGAKSEYLYSYLALTDLPETAAGLGGLADEHEDIRAHVIAYTTLTDLVASGEINNAPLLLSVMALGARRSDLRLSSGQSR